MKLFEMLAVFPSTCEKTFFGLKPWYHYLTPQAGTCDIARFKVLAPNSDIPLVLLAIVDDLLRVGGIVAVVFVIYGAVGLINSDGAPDKAAKARETVINSLVGLAVVIVAVAFVGFLGSRLGG